MSDASLPPPRPVSVVTVLAILACFALFLVLVRLTFSSRPPAYIPETEVPDKLSADQAWQATPESRAAYLTELRDKQQKQATSYGWVDQKAGIVQVPIDRAMDLIVQDASKPQP